MRIRSAVLRERGGPFTIEDVELADPGPGEVLVEIAGTGFCHTDLLPRAKGFMAEPPLILGHEGSGVVRAKGSDVDDLAIGDPVVLSFDHCGSCTACGDGHPAYCRSFWGRNMVGRAKGGDPRVRDMDGAPIGAHWFGQSSFASHVLVAARNAVPIPKDLPLELLGPLGCGVLTGAGSILNVLQVSAGSSTAVYGAGTVGLSAVMAAAAAGAERIIAVDLHRSRLDLALELGATDVVDAAGLSTTEVSQRVIELSEGGTLTALDTTGAVPVITAGVAALRTRGTLAMVSVVHGDIVLPGDALATGKTVTGILEGDAVPRLLIPELIELWLEGRLPFDRLIRTYPISDINQAEADMASGTTIKPVLIPGGQA
ncbi:MAG: aryl-alcohol dehydrogenase [Nocardioidaceae bacterium]|jgi:aryl-alcohol dehydrogenase|nr:aryl-alcohol dehydrogenase [Nocardioidaceae bacterium]